MTQQFTTTDNTEHLQFNPMTYVSKPRPQPVEEFPMPKVTPTASGHFVFQDINRISEIAKAVGEHETDWLQDKDGKYYKAKTIEERYNYQQPYSKAIGYYQVEPDSLKTLSKKYLGKEIAPEDFRKNPKLQDELITKVMIGRMSDNYTSKGAKYRLTEEEAIKAWNVGVSGDFNGEKATNYIGNVSKFLTPKKEEATTTKKETKKPGTAPAPDNLLANIVASLKKVLTKKDGTTRNKES